MTVLANISDRDLLDFYARFEFDPLGFTKIAFPWGKAGTELERLRIEAWQAEELRHIGDNIGKGMPLQIAIRSGHGVGKSTFAGGFVSVWALLTRERTKVILTANTEVQLRTKTMPEVQKWMAMTPGARWFDTSSTYIRSKAEPTRWSLEAVPWSAANTSGFQGTHNLGNRTVFVLDEASEIPEAIFTAAQGGINDAAQGVLLATGNPSLPEGAFFECFNKNRKFWHTRTIDSREVSFANKAYLNQLLEQYGHDSDAARIRVYGLPPVAGSSTFIAPTLVAAATATTREPPEDIYAPVVVGVDVAKGLASGDRSVIAVRQGLRLLALNKFRNTDEMQLIGHIIDAHGRYKADVIFVDGVGVGSGVVSRLKQLQYNVVEVNGGARANDAKRYKDKNAEMWARMKEWLTTGKLPHDTELEEDLTQRRFDYDGVSGALVMESVKQMKARGLASPDCACAFSYTFAENVARRDTAVLLRHYNVAAQPYQNANAMPSYDVLNWS